MPSESLQMEVADWNFYCRLNCSIWDFDNIGSFLVSLTPFFPHDADYHIFFAELKISDTSTDTMLAYITIACTPIEIVSGA